MYFERPYLVALLLLIPLLLLLHVVSMERRRRDVERFFSPTFVRRHPHLLEGGWRVGFLLYLVGVAMLIIALAGPKIGLEKGPSIRREGEAILLIDASISMVARDVKPSRFERAKGMVVQILDSLGGERVGLVAFASAPLVISPPTQDYEALKVFVETLDPSIFIDRGTSLERALEASIPLFEGGGKRSIVLLTDGDGIALSDRLIRRLVSEGIRMYIIGIGTTTGAPIPVVERGISVYKRDEEGRIVVTRLEEGVLESIASMTGGRYFRDRGERTGRRLASYLGEEKEALEGRDRIAVYRDGSGYFLLTAMATILLSIFAGQKGRVIR